jgi:hypothetical protein
MYEHEPKPQPLTLAFIGYNEEQTRRYFVEFARVNSDQVSYFNDREGRIRLTDGTLILRAPNDRNRLMGCRFDQVVVAVDARGLREWSDARCELLNAVRERMWCSCIPRRFLTIVYDLSSKVIPNE